MRIKVPDWLDRICAWPLLQYRRLRFGYPFRRIRLTDVSGVVPMSFIGTKSEGKFTIVDPEDFYWLNIFCWFAYGRIDILYAARAVRTQTGLLKIILMHRQISNAPLGRLIDHINTNSLDNRKANLRLATPSQNSCNSRRDKSKTYSRYRGVSFSKRKQKWFSAIRADGRKLWLGYFDNELDAALAYDRAAKKYHGCFARLNFE